jgi:hypothetical protein
VDQYLDQIKFLLEAAWDKAAQEAGAHIGLVVVGAAAVVLLLWLFLLPGVKKKGY